MIKRLLREPLIHFLLLALGLFLFLDGTESDTDTNVIRISLTKTQAMQTQFQQRWGRLPNTNELDDIIDSAVAEELYYREGLTLGLDLGDAVIKNRIVQKMKFLQSEQISEPNQEQLQDWLVQNKDKYPVQITYSFRQIYLGKTVSQVDADSIAAQLNTGVSKVDDVGESLFAPKQMDKARLQSVSRNFGEDFSLALDALPINTWTGPVLSGFGSHLVNVANVQSIATSLDTPGVLQKVRNDWAYAKKNKLEQAYIQRQLEHYEIEIERP